jgi:hypothetical protein
MNITIDILKNTISKKGYKWYTDRPNLIGIRTTLDVPDSFNDFFCLVYSIPVMNGSLSLKEKQAWLNRWGFIGANGKKLAEDGVAGKNTDYAMQKYSEVVGKETLKIFPNTTNPGVYWLNNPMSKLGTAVLKANQWVDCWSLGFHQRKSDHRALVQTGKVTVYRDNNKDNNYQLNEAKVESGLFGINIHGSGKLKPSTQIGKWSAGCNVFSNWSHKEFVMDICQNFKTTTGNKFTYTLLDEKDLS